MVINANGLQLKKTVWLLQQQAITMTHIEQGVYLDFQLVYGTEEGLIFNQQNNQENGYGTNVMGG